MGGSLLSGGVATFGESLLSGFTSSHKKWTLLSGGRYYRNFTVVCSGLFEFLRPAFVTSRILKIWQCNLEGIHSFFKPQKTIKIAGSKMIDTLKWYKNVKNTMMNFSIFSLIKMSLIRLLPLKFTFSVQVCLQQMCLVTAAVSNCWPFPNCCEPHYESEAKGKPFQNEN